MITDDPMAATARQDRRGSIEMTGTMSLPIEARSCALDRLKAARAEPDAIVAQGCALDAVDRLNGVAALVEEAISDLDGSRR